MRARDNPFATSRLERVLAFEPEWIGTSWEEIEARWEALGRRACVVGRHGSGKTTFLEAFAQRMEPKQRVRRLFFNDGHPRLDTEDREMLARAEGAVLLVDGDRHLPLAERRELRRSAEGARGMLSARHSRGELPVLLELKADLDLARLLLEKVAPEWVEALELELPRMMRKHGGNLRELWMACYDEVAAKH